MKLHYYFKNEVRKNPFHLFSSKEGNGMWKRNMKENILGKIYQIVEEVMKI